MTSGSTIREDNTTQGNIAGEEAFYIKIMTSPLGRHGVTWRHRENGQSIAHAHFPTVHTGTICKINFQHIARIPVCIGDRWGVVRGEHDPLPKIGKIFFGQLSRKIRAFCEFFIHIFDGLISNWKINDDCDKFMLTRGTYRRYFHNGNFREFFYTKRGNFWL